MGITGRILFLYNSNTFFLNEPVWLTREGIIVPFEPDA